MKKYPQTPDQWEDPEFTLYRRFKFQSTPDIECLMRLVKDNLYDGGNERFLRARLLGILRSMWSDANARFWEQHYHPRTWRIRLFWRNLKQTYRRRFNTRKYRGELFLCKLAKEVADESIKKEKNNLEN